MSASAFVFLNMMVGAILEVMSAEHNTEIEEQAHLERTDMHEQLDHLQRQMDTLIELVRNGESRPAGAMD